MKEPWTPKTMGAMMSLGGTTPMPIGTPEYVADFMEKWFNESGIDGFNLTCKHVFQSFSNIYLLTSRLLDVSNPGSFEDIVEYLVPILQERGLMWKDYPVPGGTFRENLQNTPGESFLPPTHPAKSKFERPNYLAEDEAVTKLEAKKNEVTNGDIEEKVAAKKEKGAPGLWTPKRKRDPTSPTLRKKEKLAL